MKLLLEVGFMGQLDWLTERLLVLQTRMDFETLLDGRTAAFDTLQNAGEQNACAHIRRPGGQKVAKVLPQWTPQREVTLRLYRWKYRRTCGHYIVPHWLVEPLGHGPRRPVLEYRDTVNIIETDKRCEYFIKIC